MWYPSFNPDPKDRIEQIWSSLTPEERRFYDSFRLRTVTLGISLLDCISDDWDTLTDNIKEKLKSILPTFSESCTHLNKRIESQISLVKINEADSFIQTLRIALTPLSLVTASAIRKTMNQNDDSINECNENLLHIAREITSISKEYNIEFVGGYGALIQKGFTTPEYVFLKSIPFVLSDHEIMHEEVIQQKNSYAALCSSVNVASTSSGINLDSCNLAVEILLEIARRDYEFYTMHKDTIQLSDEEECERKQAEHFLHSHDILRESEQLEAIPYINNNAKFAVFCNAPGDNPFMAGGFCGVEEPQYSVNVGINGSGVLTNIIAQVMQDKHDLHIESILEVTQIHVTNMAKIAEYIKDIIRKELHESTDCHVGGIVDLSIAPAPQRENSSGRPWNSIAGAVSAFTNGYCGSPGTLTALYALIDIIKKAGSSATPYVGGLSGTFIPISEDAGMADAATSGALSLDRYVAMTSVCSVGVDMVPLHVPENVLNSKNHKGVQDTFTAFVSDIMAIGVSNDKTLSARLLPVPFKPGKTRWVFLKGGAGLLGYSPIFSIRDLSQNPVPHGTKLRGQIQGSVKSLKN